MVELVSVYREREAILILYDLLKERTPEQSISHKSMPTMDEHAAFVRSNPYQAWYLIKADEYVGAIYLSKQREIGVFVFERHQGKGYAREAVEELMKRWPGKFLWNTNPSNERSIKLVESLGGRLIQWTYQIG